MTNPVKHKIQPGVVFFSLFLSTYLLIGTTIFIEFVEILSFLLGSEFRQDICCSFRIYIMSFFTLSVTIHLFISFLFVTFQQ